MQTKLTNAERRKAYYMKIWGLDEKNSHTDAHRFIKQPAPEPYHPPKFVKLNNWNWKQNFNSLEEAAEFLLNYCKELGPLSEECLQRLNKNAETIRQLTITNKNLRRSLLTNDYTNKDRQE
tara:strand:+ start:212 stop:574 length:363 start_codon:yes stop_codon:yes gene_type:complete